MAERAYVLIETQVGKVKAVVKDIRGLQGLVSVDAVTGPYDVIATIEMDNLNEIGDFVTAKIHTVKGISRIVTCLAVKNP